ncbi:MAG: carbohydrate porin [Proteobacteria bacterium]|nr:carbohydrate porin [Pseudomonadota bacterium]
MKLELPHLAIASLCVLGMTSAFAQATDSGAEFFVPQLLGAQYTFIDQHQDALRSPYSSPLSLRANGDTARSHTFGAYFGVQLPWHLQFYLDAEMFKGAGVSNATGMAGLTNGDVIRSGTVDLGKRPYVARRVLRYTLPLSEETTAVDAAQDQLPGLEYGNRIEVKVGKFAASDDFDKNRYANSTRTQFMNWALFNNAAWDFAADTRGYTNGAMLALVQPAWTLRYGIFQMPREANGQALEWPLARARGEQVELTWQPDKTGYAIRLLAYRNIARMGVYRDALAAAQATGEAPDIRADDRDGRRKYGYALNAELPLTDDGETGLFARLGWSDGRTESFAFTEAERSMSLGAQLSGTHWGRNGDRFAIAIVATGIAHDHRDYLAAGGSGFLVGDGRLDYARERIVEVYYSLKANKYISLSPDFQYAWNPGYNKDRGPAKFFGLRAHVEM